MAQAVRRIFAPLLGPALMILGTAVLALLWPDLVPRFSKSTELTALVELLPVLPYVVYLGALLIGWRYGSSGMVMASVTLFLGYAAITQEAPPASALGPATARFSGIFIPINLVLCTWIMRRRPVTPVGALFLALVGLESLFAATFSYPKLGHLVAQVTEISPKMAQDLASVGSWFKGFFGDTRFSGSEALSAPALIVFLWAVPFLFIRYLLDRQPLLAGFFSAGAAVFLAVLVNDPTTRILFFLTAGLIFLVTSFETSFTLAFRDELTGLPGRRALNDMLVNLGKKYAIAMMDIDHFKKFNDTYGHKTGDQVLRMIAARMNEIPGGARVFRYGGEEFTAVFPGKDPEEAEPLAEKFRSRVAETPFTIRGKARKKRTAQDRGKMTLSTRKRVKVTVSVGLAGPGPGRTTPEAVLKAADQALYKAKHAGRNRVKVQA